MLFSNIRTDFNFIFGKFSVARKLILNGGAIRPTDLLLRHLYQLSLLSPPAERQRSFSNADSSDVVGVNFSLKSWISQKHRDDIFFFFGVQLP